MNFKEGMSVKIKGVSFSYRVCVQSAAMEKNGRENICNPCKSMPAR